jgi:hypothetical protein
MKREIVSRNTMKYLAEDNPLDTLNGIKNISEIKTNS